MNEKVLLTVKTDKKLKEAAQRVARDMGVPLSAIVNAQLQRVVEERSITFHAPLPSSSKAGKRVAALAKDADPKNWSKPLHSVAKVRTYLDSLK